MDFMACSIGLAGYVLNPCAFQMVPGDRGTHENLQGLVADADVPQHLLDLLQNRTAAAGRRRPIVINIG
jgi:hypothetical protein